MPVQKQIIDIPLGGGINTEVDPKLLPQGALRSVNNGEYNRSGEISKSPGFAALRDNEFDSAPPVSPASIGSVYDTLLMHSADGLRVWSPSGGSWKKVGNIPTGSITKAVPAERTLPHNGNWQAAYAGDLVAITNTGGGNGGDATVIFDLESGSIVDAPSSTSWGYPLYWPAFPDCFFFYDGTTIRKYNFKTQSASTFATVSVDSQPMLVHIKSTNELAACGLGGASLGVRVVSYDSSGSAGAFSIYADSGFTSDRCHLHWNDEAERLHVINHRSGATSLVVRVYDDTATQDWTDTLSNTPGVTVDGINMATIDDPVTPEDVILVNTAQASGTIITSYTEVWRLDQSGSAASSYTEKYTSLQSRSQPWAHEGEIFMLASFAGNAEPYPQRTSYIVRVASGGPYPVARLTPGVAGVLGDDDRVAGVRKSGSVARFIDFSGVRNESTDPEYSFENGVINVCEFDHSSKTGFAPFSGGALTSSGFVGFFDGKEHVENGIFQHPIIETGSPTASGGDVAPAGDYVTGMVYQIEDSAGLIHRSAPGVSASTTLNGTTHTRVAHTTYYLRLSARTPADISLATYRTAADGSVYYTVKLASNSTGSPSTTVFWDYDAADESNAVLYTDGGILDAVAPPCPYAMLITGTRGFIVPGDDRTGIWISKPVEDTVALEFSDSLIKRIPEGGDITGLADLDGKIIVFKERQIRAFSGSGPNALGQGSYSDDFLIASDVGCISPRSVVTFSGGVVFQSAAGIYLLNRALQLQYIGAPVAEYNSESVIRSVLHQDKRQIVMLTSGDRLLCFDHYHGTWTTRDASGATDITVWKGKLCLLRQDGRVFVENDTFTKPDSTEYNTLDVRTGWIRVSGIQGFNRVLQVALSGELKSPHTLVCEIFHNYDESTPVETFEVKSTDVEAGPDGSYYWRRHPKHQQCAAIQFRFYDKDQSGTGESLSMSALTLEIAGQPGINRMGASRSK